MAKNTVSLSTKEELKIFMSPQRQQIIRAMSLCGDPVTAKMLSDMLCISASSATHHLRLLEKIGVVKLNHTERINGITARYYSLSDVIVSIGLQDRDDLKSERSAVIQNILLNTLEGFNGRLEWAAEKGIPNDLLTEYGDFLSGVIHLTRDESAELMRIIKEYLELHGKRQAGAQPWEYALILYQADVVR